MEAHIMKLYKIGDQWYRLDGTDLVAVDAPETEPADGEYFDASDIVGEFDGIADLDAVRDRTNELIGAFNTARTEALTDPSKLPAAREAQEMAAIARHLHAERKTANEALGPEAATLPNEPADKPGDDSDSDGDNKPDENDTDTGSNGDGDDNSGDGNGDGDGTDVVVPDDASALTGEVMAQIAGAMTAAGADPASVLSALTPGGRKPSQVPAPKAEAAVIVAGANTGFGVGHEMSLEDITAAHQNFARGNRRGNLPGSITIGTFQMYGDKPNMIASSESVEAAGGKLDAASAAEFHALRAGSRGVIAAAPERCGPRDVRREIKYAGDDSSPLLGLLETYPAPHCELEYYRDITLGTVSDSVGRWDATARAAYEAARDAWLGDMTAANLAALKAAEKLCLDAGCPPTDTVDMLAIYACMEYPTDLEFCAPQAIRAYWRALMRAYTRERSANFLAVLATKSARITVDASDPFFRNNVPIYDGTNLDQSLVAQLGATAVIDYVMSSVLPLGVMQERVTEGNYVGVIPFGLQRLLEMENRLAEGQEMIADALGLSRVVTSLDVATGSTIPWSAAPAQDGTTTDFVTSLLPPTAWDIAVFDPDDWFAISRPDIEVGAQVTPETVKAGNRAFGGFVESFEGYGKDGAHPSYTIALSNLVYNGARIDKINPAGLLTASAFLEDATP